jgi:hypothetical protein
MQTPYLQIKPTHPLKTMQLIIAIAKLQKKGLLYRQPKAIQLELFEDVKVED